MLKVAVCALIFAVGLGDNQDIAIEAIRVQLSESNGVECEAPVIQDGDATTSYFTCGSTFYSVTNRNSTVTELFFGINNV